MGTIAIPTKGQAFAWDTWESGKIYLISKAGREIIVGQVTLNADQLRPGRDEMRSVGAQTEAGPTVAH